MCLASLLLAGQARANFHLWKIDEIYSNGDESVQFIELFPAARQYGAARPLAGFAKS
jgi:hypothetical protein